MRHRAQFLRRCGNQMCLRGELSAGEQRFFNAAHVAGVLLANEYLKTGIIRKLKFNAVTAAAGTRLRGTYQVHFTNAGKTIRHDDLSPMNAVNRFNGRNAIRLSALCQDYLRGNPLRG